MRTGQHIGTSCAPSHCLPGWCFNKAGEDWQLAANERIAPAIDLALREELAPASRANTRQPAGKASRVPEALERLTCEPMQYQYLRATADTLCQHTIVHNILHSDNYQYGHRQATHVGRVPKAAIGELQPVISAQEETRYNVSKRVFKLSTSHENLVPHRENAGRQATIWLGQLEDSPAPAFVLAVKLAPVNPRFAWNVSNLRSLRSHD